MLLVLAMLLTLLPVSAMAIDDSVKKDILKISYSLDGNDWKVLETTYDAGSWGVKAPENWQLPDQDTLWLKVEAGNAIAAADQLESVSISWQCASENSDVTMHYEFDGVQPGDAVQIPLALLGAYDEYDYFMVNFKTKGSSTVAGVSGTYKLNNLMTGDATKAADLSFLESYVGTYGAFTLSAQDGVYYTVIADETKADGTLAAPHELGDVYVRLNHDGKAQFTYLSMGYGVNAYFQLGNDGITAMGDYTYDTQAGQVTVPSGTKLVRQKVAQVGDQSFDTLDAAFAAAGDGATVQLLCDVAQMETLTVPEGKVMTLDLNGHALRVMDAGAGVVNYGTLTIQDSTAAEGSHGVGSGRLYTSDVEAQGRSAVENYGTLTINSGIFGDSDTNQSNGNAVQRGNAVRNNGTATINGGAFTCCDNYTNGGYAYAIANGGSSYPNASMTVNAAVAYGSINGLLACDGGKLTVKDGSYTLGDGTESNLWRIAYTSGSGSIELQGGTYTRNVKNDYGFFGAYGDAILVSGGTFENAVESKGIYVDRGAVYISSGDFKDDLTAAAKNTTVKVSGGEFTNDVTQYLQDGYQLTGEDGNYAVKPGGTTIFASGTGTESDPYVIKTLDQLKAFRDSVNGGKTYQWQFIRLDADMDLAGEEWEPIGITKTVEEKAQDFSFQGTFDGNNHVIRNLTMTSADLPYYSSMDANYHAFGFFGGVSGGTVKNLRFADVAINKPGSDVDNNTVAAAVGAAVNGATISNITIKSGSVTGYSRTAGVVGYVGGSKTGRPIAVNVGNITVQGCVNNAAVTSDNTASSYGTAAGICATYNGKDSTGGNITFADNRNTGEIEGFYAAGILASAFVNDENHPLDLTGNINTGVITGSGNRSKETPTAAGIAVANAVGTIEGNVNGGAINCSDGMAGGILATASYDTVFGTDGNTNTGAISGRQAGGIVAVVDGAALVNLTNSGSVNGTEQAGGIAALIRNEASLDGTTCVGSGAVTGAADSAYVGKLVGNVAVKATLKNLTDSDAIGAVTAGGNGSYSVTLDNVQLDTLDLVAGHNQGFTYTMNLTNGSSIGTLAVDGAIHTGMTLEISGGTVQLVNVTNMTGNTEAGEVKSTTLNFAAADGAQIGTLRTTDASNNLTSLKVAADAQSRITTVEAASAVAAGFGHGKKTDTNKNTDEREFPNAGTIQTMKTSVANYTTTSTTGENHAPENVLLTSSELTEDAVAILNGTATANKTGFTGVELTADETLDALLAIAKDKTLVIAKGVTLAIPKGTTLTNYGQIVNYGTIVNQNEDGDMGQVTNRYLVTFQDDDGTVLFTQDVAENEKVAKPADPVREGYVFDGWYLNGAAYDFDAKVNAHLTLTAQWHVASSGSVTYSVSVASAANGKVTISTTRASKGSTVTITVTPNEGYALEKLTVTDANGNAVSVTKVSDTKYTFKMPASKVTVKATFEKAELVSSLPFTDVDVDDWFYEAVEYVYDNGMMNGTTSTKFGPNAQLTRGMIVTILYRLENEPAVSGNDFVDVNPSQYYADPIAWAAKNGIVTGYGDGTFGPDKSITREQLAAILYRYASYKGYDVSKSADLSAYTDADSVSSYAKDAMAWANAEGLITGVTATTLNPTGTATRAQVATILMRFCENIAK